MVTTTTYVYVSFIAYDVFILNFGFAENVPASC